MSDKKCARVDARGPTWNIQIGFNYFTGKVLGENETSSESSAPVFQGTVLAASWDKVLLQNGSGTHEVFGNTSHKITINCQEIEDAVFLQSSLCFIENGKIKTMNFEKCEFGEMDSTSHWRKISAIESEEKMYAITDKGQLYVVRDKTDNIPKWIPLIVRVTQVSCGISHGIALADNGTLYTWGNGSRGQLGHGSTDDQDKLTLVDLLCGVEITAIAAGGWHSMALADTGDVYVWGWNVSGQLGFPTKSLNERKNQHVPKSSDNSGVGMLMSPKLLELEHYTRSETFISICSISCGSRHSVAVTVEGNAISWGWGKYGQLGQKCCISTKPDNLKESESKKSKLNIKSAYSSTCECNAEEHLPGLVEYFCHERYRAVEVYCGRWNTYISYTQTVT